MPGVSKCLTRAGARALDLLQRRHTRDSDSLHLDIGITSLKDVAECGFLPGPRTAAQPFFRRRSSNDQAAIVPQGTPFETA
jgi:hypothetical protein